MSNASPASLRRVAERVETRIDALLSSEIERWKDIDPDLAEPLVSLRSIVLAGGKRLRPAFCHWGFVGAGGDPADPSATDAGAALELLHSFAVLHDDVMDASRTRHGVDAVHATHEARHRAAKWRGEARRFGEGVAVLVGDLAFVYADQLLAAASPEALEVFTELRLEVNLGQYLDLVGTARGDSDPEVARRICLYKSGKYTVERPLHMGAALAGRLSGERGLAAAYSGYGLAVGEVFQLRDDLLGVFGDPAVTGKPVGEDLREGKPTPLYSLALSSAGGAGATLLRSRYGAADLAVEEVAQLQQVITESGARHAIEMRIDELCAQGVAALDDVALAGDAAAELVQLAHFVATRHF